MTTPQRRVRLRRGLTLVELVVTMALMTVLLGGIASTILIATHALPDEQTQPDAVATGYEVVERIAGELCYALSFKLVSTNAVRFAVADRDGDGTPEEIGYAWSGVPGTALMRQYNGGTAVKVVDDVYEFELAYGLGGSSVASAGIRLRVGADPSSRVETAVQVLNAPDVSGI